MNTLPCLLLLTLTAPALGQISIDVIASENESERKVHASGSDVNVISDIERDTFKLYDAKLKQAVKSYIGEKPDDVYVKSPTPWGDLYQTYDWNQVNRILKPISCKTLSVKYDRVLVFTQVFRNPSTKIATYVARIRENVEDTIASIWETSGVLTTGFNIFYGFDIAAMGVSGKASMTYSSKWGQNVMKSQTVTVGSETGLVITLQPNQSAKAELFATTGLMIVQVDYEATLGGILAVNYDGGYKNHHFYGLDVNEVLSAGNLTRSVLSSENITLGYYMDSEIVVHDYDNGDILYYPNLDLYKR